MCMNPKQTVGLMLFFSLLAGGNTVAYAITKPQQAAVQQENTCVGTIVDGSGEPIVGASVLVKSTLNGTISDVDGRFSLKNVRPGSLLVISYVGYLTQEIVWNGQPLHIILAEDTQMLDDVVVVGIDGECRADCLQQNIGEAQRHTDAEIESHATLALACRKTGTNDGKDE